VLYEKTPEGVAIITLNKPERMNGWNGPFGEAWFDAYDRAEADNEVRVIVVTNNGRAWCAGADMAGLQDISSAGGIGANPKHGMKEDLDLLREQSKVFVDSKGRQISHALSLSKPVIAAINGSVAGGGFSQAMACDIRFAAEDVAFSSAFARRGLIAEWGVSHLLPRTIGTGNALDLLLSARKFKAPEAKELGVVQRVYPRESLLREAILYATDMAVNVPPASLRIIKQQVYKHLDLDHNTALQQTNQLMVLSTREKPFKEGVASYVEKRLPRHGPIDANTTIVKTADRILAKL